MLLVVAFFLGYAAPYLSPRHFWWLDLFAVGIPMMSVPVGALALVLGGQGYLWGQWRRAALGGILLVFLVARFGHGLAAWGPSPDSTDALRVMTFNVPRMLMRDSAQAHALKEIVQREAPHVLAVQESKVRTRRGADGPGRGTSAGLRALLEAPEAYALPKGYPIPARIQQPVLGRVSLDSMSMHSLPPDGEKNSRARYTRTSFTWRGRSVVLYNIHLHTVGEERPWLMMPGEWVVPAQWKEFLRTYRRSTLRRAQQARLIRRRIEREDRPVIVVGDFNSTPHQWAYWHIAQGLQNAVNRRVPGWSATFPAEYPLVQIDHVMAGPDWQATAAHISGAGTPPVSDHRPVVVDLRWKDQ